MVHSFLATSQGRDISKHRTLLEHIIQAQRSRRLAGQGTEGHHTKGIEKTHSNTDTRKPSWGRRKQH